MKKAQVQLLNEKQNSKREKYVKQAEVLKTKKN